MRVGNEPWPCDVCIPGRPTSVPSRSRWAERGAGINSLCRRGLPAPWAGVGEPKPPSQGDSTQPCCSYSHTPFPAGKNPELETSFPPGCPIQVVFIPKKVPLLSWHRVRKAKQTKPHNPNLTQSTNFTNTSFPVSFDSEVCASLQSPRAQSFPIIPFIATFLQLHFRLLNNKRQRHTCNSLFNPDQSRERPHDTFISNVTSTDVPEEPRRDR